MFFWVWFSLGTSPGGADRWFISLYGGMFSDNALLDIARLQTNFDNSSILVLSAGREIGRYRNKISLELEGQIAFHNGHQSHQEMNAVFIARWLQFPWDHLIDTSMAVGNGLSYATKEPPIEILDSKNGKSSQWLYYLLIEIAFGLCAADKWDLFVRVHHRSGIYGLIHDVDSGSNFIGCGLRRRF